MKVLFRQREKNNRISLYLEYDYKVNRNYQYLDIFLFTKPEKGKLTKAIKNDNKTNQDVTKSIRSKRQLEIQNGIYGFADHTKMEVNFINYSDILKEKPKESKSNYCNWYSVLQHLKKFDNEELTFAEIDSQWLEKFKDYISKKAKPKLSPPPFLDSLLI